MVIPLSCPNDLDGFLSKKNDPSQQSFSLWLSLSLLLELVISALNLTKVF